MCRATDWRTIYRGLSVTRGNDYATSTLPRSFLMPLSWKALATSIANTGQPQLLSDDERESLVADAFGPVAYVPD